MRASPVNIACLLLVVGCSTDDSAKETSANAFSQSPARGSDEQTRSGEASANSPSASPNVTTPAWLLGCWEFATEYQCWMQERETGEFVGASFPAEAKTDVVATERYSIKASEGERVLVLREEGEEPVVYEFSERGETSFKLVRRGDGGWDTIEYELDDELEIRRTMETEDGPKSATRRARRLDSMSTALMTRMANALHASHWRTAKRPRKDVSGITVYSKPGNVAIFVDGVESGQRTASTVELGPGNYSVAVQCPGDGDELSEPKEVSLGEDSRVKLFFRCD